MNYLVSGSSNGFGKYLAKKFQSDIYNRHDKSIFNYKDNTHYQSIIHCAFGRPKIGEKESDFIDSQLEIAEDLLKYNHSKFVIISSIDTNALELTLYAKAKIAVENLIKKSSDLYLIIKPGSLFGDGMKLNTMIKVALNKDKPWDLHPTNSLTNSVHEDRGMQYPPENPNMAIKNNRKILIKLVTRLLFPISFILLLI